MDIAQFTDEKYRSKFALEYMGGSTGIGVSSGTFGSRAGLAGGIQMLFGDILGNNRLYSVVALNGDLLDFGASTTYLNTKGRIAWGATLGHVPYRTGFVSYSLDTLGVVPVFREDINILRIFEDNAGLLMHYPFSRATRWELSGGINYQYYRLDKYPNYYHLLSDGTVVGPFIGQGNRERVPLDEDEIRFGNYRIKRGVYYNIGTAFVGDQSAFGITAPMNGYRYRLDVQRSIGEYDFWSTTADGRIYQYLRPVTLAFRILQHSRYGADANSFNPILVGYQGLVHGYEYNQIIKLLGARNPDPNISFNALLTEELFRLSGSKIAVSSVEVRLPFTGPQRLSLIKSGFFFSDLSWFFDAGVAFDEFSHFRDGEPIHIERIDPNTGFVITETIFRKPRLAMSTGIGLRVNLFGALIVEPYVAYPIQKDSRLLLGIFFVPGW